MTPLPELIEHWRERAKECGDEIDELVARHNASPASGVTDAEIRQGAAFWREHQRFARDTVSYLEVLLNRGAGGRAA